MEEGCRGHHMSQLIICKVMQGGLVRMTNIYVSATCGWTAAHSGRKARITLSGTDPSARQHTLQ